MDVEGGRVARGSAPATPAAAPLAPALAFAPAAAPAPPAGGAPAAPAVPALPVAALPAAEPEIPPEVTGPFLPAIPVSAVAGRPLVVCIEVDVPVVSATGIAPPPLSAAVVPPHAAAPRHSHAEVTRIVLNRFMRKCSVAQQQVGLRQSISTKPATTKARGFWANHVLFERSAARTSVRSLATPPNLTHTILTEAARTGRAPASAAISVSGGSPKLNCQTLSWRWPRRNNSWLRTAINYYVRPVRKSPRAVRTTSRNIRIARDQSSQPR
jgi:hypothetical protein